MKSLLSLLALLAFSPALSARESNAARVLDEKFHHLGDSVVEDWPEVSKQPAGPRLDLRFNAEKNKKDLTLSFVAWDLNFPLKVEINGQKANPIQPILQRKKGYLTIPAGALKKGENVVTLTQTQPQDDCAIGKFTLHTEPFRDLLGLQPVTVSVLDEGTGQTIPARITITHAEGNRASIYFAPTNGTAIRQGLIYSRGDKTTLHLEKGDYIFYATHGMEWSRDKQTVSVQPGQTTQVRLKIRREVETPGFVAADTHLHTLTFSGHGDASIQERMITLAGEGVEVAIATDHNHQIDYRPYQRKAGLSKSFTPIVGNEVSTRLGHFNAFPFPATTNVPNHKETNWVRLLDGIRAKGAKVIILNHPHWSRLEVFKAQGLNSLTGERATKVPFTIDGIELANSGNLVTNVLALYRDWFALLNYGDKIAGVGSSDSHGVDAIVGQGRTYVRSSTDNAAKVNVDEFCDTFLAGDTTVSLGIFADVMVDKRFKMGDLVPVKNAQVQIQLRVAAPSWVKPRRVLVFANGQVLAEQSLHPVEGQPMNQLLNLSVPAPRHDAHLVCLVLGDPVTEVFWPTVEPYTLASSNPVYLDADNDGRYESPRQTALHILAKSKTWDEQWREVMQAGDGVALQLLALMREAADEKGRAALRENLQKAAAERKCFGEFLKTL